MNLLTHMRVRNKMYDILRCLALWADQCDFPNILYRGVKNIWVKISIEKLKFQRDLDKLTAANAQPLHPQ